MVFDLLRSLGTHLDRDRSDDLSDARAKALAGFASARRGRGARFPGPAALALAAAGTAAIVVVPVLTFHGDRDGGTLAVPRERAVPAPPAPRADQLVYVDRVSADGKKRFVYWFPQDPENRPQYTQWIGEKRSFGTPVAGRPGFRQMWGCKGSSVTAKLANVKGTDRPPDCPPPGPDDEPDDFPSRPGYLGGLPTDPPALLSWIGRLTRPGNPPAVGAFRTAGEVLGFGYAPPATAKAFFETMRSLPGVVVTEGVADGLGRVGVELSQAWHGYRLGYVFDSATFGFLGERGGLDLTGPQYVPEGEAGQWRPTPEQRAAAEAAPVRPGWSVVGSGVVDRYGQVPG